MITDIRLQHFRSYSDGSFEFDQGVNIIVGPNASGKTNLLEGVQMACLGKSYRAKDTDLLEHDQPWARIDAHTPTGTRVVKITPAAHTATNKLFEIDDVPYRRLSLHKTIPVVLFEPNHLQLLNGSPDGRREYLDGLIEQTVSGFATVRRQYKRTLAQRNNLLKQGNAHNDQLFAWNIRLSQLGGQIAAQRLQVIAHLNSQMTGLYRNLSSTDGTIAVSYTSGCEATQYGSDMLYKLEQTLQTDLERGFTGFGPHRDDVLLVLNMHAASETASRGEVRTLVLAMKIVELQLIEQSRGQKPVLLLDDVFSELDGARRHALTTVLRTHQTFITTTDADIVVKNFSQHSNVIALA